MSEVIATRVEGVHMKMETNYDFSFRDNKVYHIRILILEMRLTQINEVAVCVLQTEV